MSAVLKSIPSSWTKCRSDDYVQPRASEVTALKDKVNIHRIGVKRDVRINVDLVALLHKHSYAEYEEPMVTAKLLNLGQGGALATSVAPVGIVGDEIEVSMLLPCSAQSVGLSLKAKICDIRYVADAKDKFVFFYSIQFMNVSHEDGLCIRSFLFDTLINSGVS
ncbi:MAG: PilZ domain-containing protein [Methylotenera sp.]|jgi:hypothetical protein